MTVMTTTTAGVKHQHRFAFTITTRAACLCLVCSLRVPSNHSSFAAVACYLLPVSPSWLFMSLLSGISACIDDFVIKVMPTEHRNAQKKMKK